ncbi:S-adenosyl-L-methionine-dependent methyltransferase [Xylariaceae sp. FL0594]|nr:S-adenosyl-L-methionine-dependent methyltransferase [Xylariaceae sp. FL0594]
MADVDPQLKLFRRQYLQLFQPDFLAWPHPQLLRRADVQAWLYRHLFDGESRDARLPPERYQLRVMRPLVAKIEKAIQDPDEDEISDDLMNRIGALMTHGVPSEFDALKERAYVTFTCLAEVTSTSQRQEDGGIDEEPTITLLERRNLISGSRTTGHRTWEAALHLGAYLLTDAGRRLVEGRSVLELGAGTGFLAILCAKHLGATHVTTTDGDENVVDALKENLALNGLDAQGEGEGESGGGDGQKSVLAKRLWWGEELEGTWVEKDFDAHPYDVVIGADITYDKVAIAALVQTLGHLFKMRPGLQVIIAGVIRNLDTFQSFQDECDRMRFKVEEISYPVKQMREQTTLFYAAAVPIKILSITSPSHPSSTAP